MRELRGDDLFPLLTMIGKLDIKDDFVKLFEEQAENEINPLKEPQDHKKKEPTKVELERLEKERIEREKEIEKRGMEIMANLLQTVLLNITNVKEDINKLLADLCGVSLKEVKELGLKDYTSLIVSFFKKPELKDFFTSIASLMQ